MKKRSYDGFFECRVIRAEEKSSRYYVVYEGKIFVFYNIQEAIKMVEKLREEKTRQS
ncbi:MAG: hypothetical protein NZ822_02910 [Patescibacteria group bacterium]|nr:hypothetical protein [Patescibacteria group bacterium]